MKNLFLKCKGKIRQGITHLFAGFRHLRVLILSAMSLVTLIAMAISFVVIVQRVQGLTVDNTLINTRQVVKQSSVTIGGYLENISEMAHTIARGLSKLENEEIQDFLETGQVMGSEINSIALFEENGNAVYYAPSELTLKDNVNYRSQRWYTEDPQNQKYYFSEPHVQNIFVQQYVWVLTVYTSVEIKGEKYILVIDIDFSYIEDYCKQVNIGSRGYVFIVDGEGNLVYHPQQQMIYAGMKSEDLDFINENGDGVYEYSNDIVLAIISINNSIDESEDNAGWRAVGISYFGDARESTKEIIINLIFAFVVIFVAIVAIAVAIAQYISKPIGRIVQTMENAQDSQFTAIIHEDSYDEVKRLSASYNEMTQKIQDLMTQIKKEQRELRKTEIKALQAQINPHFLYNTLDSILWMCERGDSQGAVQMVSSLSTLFRISLNRGREIVTIKEELAHAENYLLIQSVRYKEQFSYKIDVPERLLDNKVPKIIIQPFLENSIYHGFGHSIDKGMIQIRVMESEGDKLLIEIEDNGVGMPEEIVERINIGKITSKSGIGISNVSSRIQIYFGHEYGVTIKSVPDEGTCIQIWLPLDMEEGNILE